MVISKEKSDRFFSSSIPGRVDYCLSFYHYIDGAKTEYIRVYIDDGQERQLMQLSQNQTKNKQPDWENAKISLWSPSDTFVIIFEGTRGRGSMNPGIAIDDITLRKGKCEIMQCDFEVNKSGDLFDDNQRDWIRINGKNKGSLEAPRIDHTVSFVVVVVLARQDGRIMCVFIFDWRINRNQQTKDFIC